MGSIKVEDPITFYVAAFACNEYGDGPGWAKVEINQKFIDELIEMHNLTNLFGLSVVERDGCVEYWQNEDEYRLQSDDLSVNSYGCFRFITHPKHADYNVETRDVLIKDLLLAISSINDAETLQSLSMTKTDLGLFYYGTTDHNDLLEMISMIEQHEEEFAE